MKDVQRARAKDTGVAAPRNSTPKSGSGGVKAGTIGKGSLVTKSTRQKKAASQNARASIARKKKKSK